MIYISRDDFSFRIFMSKGVHYHKKLIVIRLSATVGKSVCFFSLLFHSQKKRESPRKYCFP